MSYELTPLSTDVQAIIGGGSTTYFQCSVTLFNDDFEYTSLDLLSKEEIRNYAQTFQADIRLIGQCPAGVYRDTIYPQRRNLKARVTTTVNGEQYTRTYKAYLLNEEGDGMDGNSSMSSSELDIGTAMEIELQLFDPVSDVLQGYRNSGTIFRNCTIPNAVKALYGAASDVAGRIEGNEMTGVDFTPLRNNVDFPSYEVLQVVENAPLTGIVSYYQQDPRYGIYATGASRYYEKGTLYVFPTFRTDRYNSESKTLTLLVPPGDRVPAADATYITEADALKVVITDPVEIIDTSDIDLIESGTSFNSVNADTLFESPGSTPNGSVKLASINHNTSSLCVTREDGAESYTYKTDPYISSNLFKRSSRIARAAGRMVVVNWIGSESNLLHPGMSVEYRYYKDGEVHIVQGVLHQSHSFLATQDRNVANRIYVETTRMHIFVSNGLIT